MSWIRDLIDPGARSWEDIYRNRWQHDRVVRSTHGVNCTGGCSWMIHVKNGIVTWEMQALDYPKLEPSLPLYEPLPARHHLLLVHLQPDPDQISLRPRRAGRPVERSAKAPCRSGGGVGIAGGKRRGPAKLATGTGKGRFPAGNLG
jgi:hypothetical protein